MAFGDFTVTRASTKNVLGSNGLYGSVANDTPAFEFNTDGSYRGLLVEPGATNLWLYNQPADATGYTATNVTFVNASTNFTPAFATVNTVEILDATVDRTLRQNITVVNGTVYTLSFFVKVGAGVLPNTGAGSYRDFTLTINASDVLNYALITYQDVGGGVYRASHTFTSNGTTNFNIRKYSGLNNNNRVEVTGFQLETGSVATSPIVTTGSTASRVADVVSLTGASSLIGQTEGTLYAEVQISAFGNAGVFFSVSDATTSNRVQLYKFTDAKIRADRISATQSTLTSIATDVVSAGMFKVAFAYKTGDSALFINGVQIGSTATQTFTFGAMGRIDIGARFDSTQIFNDHVRSVALFPTRLANATLASITA